MSTVSIPKFYTAQEAADEIGVTDAYVRILINRERIRAQRVGRRVWIISEDEVERFKTVKMRPGGRPRISTR